MSTALANRRDDLRSPRKPIRLMIVDDSMVARAVLTRIVEADGDFDIVAVAGTGEDAIHALQQVRVDVVMLDLEMPGAGGLKSIPGIIDAAAGARILIVSSLAEEGASATIQALALGASDTIPKPGTGRFNGRFGDVLLSKLRALAWGEDAPIATAPVPSARLPRDSAVAISPSLLRHFPTGPVRLLALGASTGGIHSLSAFFQNLPQQIGAPILITQHLPEPFMQVFARQIGAAAGREAIVAEEGLRLLPDRIVIAPGNASLTVDVNAGHLIVCLDHQRSPSGCLPSVDPMLASAGALLGRDAVGVVFSGMGRDGLEGARMMVDHGGSVLVQDDVSSAVWGMPRAVAEAGLAAGIHSPAEIARRIANRIVEASCR